MTPTHPWEVRRSGVLLGAFTTPADAAHFAQAFSGPWGVYENGELRYWPGHVPRAYQRRTDHA